MKTKTLFTLACAGLISLSAQVDAIGANLGDSGYYGVIPPMSGYQPKVWNDNPIVAAGMAVAGMAAIFLNVPNNHRKNWKQYCGQYNACNKPVYFVQGNWYRKVYAPQYKKNNATQPPRQNAGQKPQAQKGNPPGQGTKPSGNNQRPNNQPPNVPQNKGQH